jgi:hypothetical protein
MGRDVTQGVNIDATNESRHRARDTVLIRCHGILSVLLEAPRRDMRTALHQHSFWMDRMSLDPVNPGRLSARTQGAGDLVVCLGAGDITTWAYALPGQLEALAK